MVLCVHKFKQNNFFCTAVDIVHTAYPFHLVVGFERFSHTFLLCHIGNDDFHTLVAGSVNLGVLTPMEKHSLYLAA